jgi:hydroxyquinol 1,2-dioxygenase
VKSGTECVLYGHVTDVHDKPLANATVSVWQTSADGLYDIQETPASTDYRGVFTTDAHGLYLVRTVKPRGYSIPMDGPVGNLVRAQARHGMRPAHIHVLVGASGYRELVTALYLRDDPHLCDDVVFGSSDDLAVDILANDPNCPISGVPSIRFDLRLAREGEADRTSGRVGSDPSAILRKPLEEENAKLAAAAAAASCAGTRAPLDAKSSA